LYARRESLYDAAADDRLGMPQAALASGGV